ncbi:hypothetical protein BC826DRAFT_309219 [Russula brevipes]|nr:hypothetical protein BC826DRAFT_309219 [Russula brevipes]
MAKERRDGPRSERSDAIMDLRAASRDSNSRSLTAYPSAEHTPLSPYRPLSSVCAAVPPFQFAPVVLDFWIATHNDGALTRRMGDPCTLAWISVHFPSESGIHYLAPDGDLFTTGVVFWSLDPPQATSEKVHTPNKRACQMRLTVMDTRKRQLRGDVRHAMLFGAVG